jgi:glycosyltransferase involved in cell wall biosynthesis
MNDVTLSICIPTYNRAGFLDHLLGHFGTAWTFDFSFEIIISDNDSTDATPQVVEKYRNAGLPIRYFRQESNKGGGPNVLNAFHRGRGAYLLYLADDDLLIPEAVTKAIAHLLANPEIRALYAPWELYDDLNKRSAGQFYAIEQDVVFQPSQALDLLRLVITRHIFPEVVIYRADAVRSLTIEHRFCFWPFTYLANMIAQGPVALQNTPFYRSVTLTPVMPERVQAGIEQVMVDWDSYRGGLEYFVYVMMKGSSTKLNGANQQSVREAIDGFIDVRMRVALRLWLARGDFLRAYELVCRLSFLDPSVAGTLCDLGRLRLGVLVQSLARLANGLSGIETIVVKGMDDLNHVVQLLKEVGLEPRITVRLPFTQPSAEERNGTLVFLSNEDDRPAMLAQGYAPGLIVSEAELMRGIHFK